MSRVLANECLSFFPFNAFRSSTWNAILRFHLHVVRSVIWMSSTSKSFISTVFVLSLACRSFFNLDVLSSSLDCLVSSHLNILRCSIWMSWLVPFNCREFSNLLVLDLLSFSLDCLGFFRFNIIRSCIWISWVVAPEYQTQRSCICVYIYACVHACVCECVCVCTYRRCKYCRRRRKEHSLCSNGWTCMYVCAGKWVCVCVHTGDVSILGGDIRDSIVEGDIRTLCSKWYICM